MVPGTPEQAPQSRRGPLAVVLGLAALVAVGLAGWMAVGGESAQTRTLVAKEGLVRVPVAEIEDGRAHFFSYAVDGAEVDFFLLKSGDGVIRAAFDSCDVCYRERKGYRQEGEMMVCNNCDQQFRSDRINEVKGGCNPAPLNRSVVGDEVVIAAADWPQAPGIFRARRTSR